LETWLQKMTKSQGRITTKNELSEHLGWSSMNSANEGRLGICGRPQSHKSMDTNDSAKFILEGFPIGGADAVD
jgi:hypothetical protein